MGQSDWLVSTWRRKASSINNHTIMACVSNDIPRQQNSWGQHGAHLGPVGLRWASCWPHEPCYQSQDLSVRTSLFSDSLMHVDTRSWAEFCTLFYIFMFSKSWSSIIETAIYGALRDALTTPKSRVDQTTNPC